ncbi:hypothetical protein BFJ69_g15694 [Fusarium oxysporum]|uniref:Amidohydrolase-related domain-containing protein n=1 Tax=Fusarium oxysporum TaxID=5507 RepID=A0A420MDD8_FUSOX|nr:hypothetical protein BFJ69_g15694 [Fusarium oxysporum]
MKAFHLNLSFLAFAAQLVAASSTLFTGGTIVGYDQSTESLEIIRNGSVLIEDDRVVALYPPGGYSSVPKKTEIIDVAGKIITPGFIDTHRHGWQTAYKTFGSNMSMIEYFFRYQELFAGAPFSADDVYIGQLAGLYESLNAGVTTTLDHAQHTWSPSTSRAGFRASVDSGARVFWAYAIRPAPNFTVTQQIADFKAIVNESDLDGTATSIGLAYDTWGPDPNMTEVNAIISLAKSSNVSVLTTHSMQGPWGLTNSPADLHRYGILNTSIPVIFSHGSVLTAHDATLLRSTNQYLSITPESEMHYGQSHPRSHLIQDQGSLGVDTHFAFSIDILTQARLWLQKTRSLLYTPVVDQQWKLPKNSPMSADQAFLLATRNGGLALRRPDLGVLAPGAKADLIVWNSDSPGMLGWVDPVAAVILHANVGDIQHVLVDGKFVKRDFRLTVPDYNEVQKRFLKSARRIQSWYAEQPGPTIPEEMGGFPIIEIDTMDVQRGDGNAYGGLNY